MMQTCFKRNVHDRSLEDIQGAAACWEPAPPFYPRLDVTSLFEASQSQHVSACSNSAGTMYMQIVTYNDHVIVFAFLCMC